MLTPSYFVAYKVLVINHTRYGRVEDAQMGNRPRLPLSRSQGRSGRRESPLRARWVHSFTAGPDGTLYNAEKHAVRGIGRDCSVAVVMRRHKTTARHNHENNQNNPTCI